MILPRLLTITTPLGDGTLKLVKLSVTEELGLPYVIEADVLGDDPDLLPQHLLTKEITATVSQNAGGAVVQRHFHGLVAEFRRTGPGAGGRMGYRLVAVPGVWRLGLRRNCRIFQGKSAKDIVQAIMGQHGLPAPSWGILPALQPIPYCTQFNETDLHFVSRLLEEHGLTYYFSHTASAHELHISAGAQGFPQYEGGDVEARHKTRGFFELGGWHRASRARSYTTKLEDMDTERSKPSEVLSKVKPTRTYEDEAATWSAGEVFHWPGGMSTRAGFDTAEVMMGSLEAASEEYGADTRDPRFAPGARLFVSVQKEDGSNQRRQYVVTGARHEAEDGSGLESGTGGVESCSTSLRLVFAARAWMPQPRHPRPLMAGVHSAKVTGPEGEKIHVDEFGRIKVKFRWDRFSKDDDSSSCWVRVMQSAAGAWGGTWFLPRVGDEVLVAFLDGDPDRPVVVGSVYGKDAKPPFQPGTNKAQSGILTRSYKSESAADANMLRFEDKKDSEEVLLHAQKDLKVEVENDETRTVGHDQTETIKNARTVTINDSHDTLTVETGNRVTTVKTGNDTHEVSQGNRSTEVKMGNDSLKIDQGNRTVELGMGNETHTIKMGDMTIKCSLGQITLEAMQKITLKVGQSSVVIDQTGVTVKGTMITEEALAMHKTKAPMVEVKADAMVQVQGALVMIN
jgi:type VI secretion system secreted protein VgrG